MTVTVVIEGIDAVLDKITTVEQMKGSQAVMQAVGLHIKGKIDKYPPATEANSPGDDRRSWYERGYGPKWRRKDGSVGGKKTSEMLGRRWTVNASSSQVVIGNNVSYGPYVQDEEHQADFHKRRGWKTAQQVAKDEEPTVKAFVEAYLEKMLK
jgi:hypothetical protein